MISTQLHPQGTFRGSRDLQLFYRSWYPPTAKDAVSGSAISSQAKSSVKSSVKGVLALVHGLGEHCGRYCAVVKGLTSAGYAVFGFDNQGHGKSEGQRGHIDSWQDYRNNVQTFLELVRQQEPTAPLFLMGHSLGGLIVLDYVLRSAQSKQFQALNVQGLVVSAPPMQPLESTASSTRIVLAKLLSGILPRFSLKMGLNGGGLSRDEAVTIQTAQDPLTHPYVTLRWGSETLSTIEWVKAHAQELKIPALLTHGEADPIISPAGSQELFDKIKSAQKALRIYPGSYHEPHNDLDAEQVVTDLVSWIQAHTATAQ